MRSRNYRENEHARIPDKASMRHIHNLCVSRRQDMAPKRMIRKV